MGKILAICTSPRRGTVKTEVPSAVLTPEWGIVGDAHGGNWHRQVSMLAKTWSSKGLTSAPFRSPAGLPSETWYWR